MVEPGKKCLLFPITQDNCYRVMEFREEKRISEYRKKLASHEMGYFAELEGRMVGSIWFTVNNTNAACIVRTYIKLLKDEALIHDIVVSEKYRGMGIGAFMASNMKTILFKDFGVKQIMTDVNIRNQASARMHEKLGVRWERKEIHISLLGKAVFEFTMKRRP